MGCFGGVCGKPGAFELACIIDPKDFRSEKKVRQTYPLLY
jgi:hypothetical protein